MKFVITLVALLGESVPLKQIATFLILSAMCLSISADDKCPVIDCDEKIQIDEAEGSSATLFQYET